MCVCVYVCVQIISSNVPKCTLLKAAVKPDVHCQIYVMQFSCPKMYLCTYALMPFILHCRILKMSH